MTQTVDDRPAPSTAPALEVRGGRKSFGAVHALRGVDITVRAGEVTALVGDNGAGKSTMIKCIAGIFPFDSGEVLVGGAPRASMAQARPVRRGSRSSTRTSPCATTSTSCTTCSSAAR